MAKLEILRDEYEVNPRKMGEYVSKIAYKHRNYALGEERIGDPIEWLEEKLGLENSYIYTNSRLEELEKKFYEEYIALPIYMYEHSMITLSTTPFSCRWDSGKYGYIYMTKEEVREEYGVKRISKKTRELVLDRLRAEIQELDYYVSGRVYGFRITDKDGEIIDSCWGFYGENFLENGMKECIDTDILGITDKKLVEILEQGV